VTKTARKVITILAGYVTATPAGHTDNDRKSIVPEQYQ